MNNNKEIQTLKQRYGIVGNYEGLNQAIFMALKVAKVDLSVLVLGENGVGKEIFSRIIHENSPRKNKPFLAINCGALPEGTIDSELFGHIKGAFTGSVESREGHFATADGGTLFLDEVGELPLQTQVRLLRVLETGEYIPVGSSEVRRTNVRIVAATNVDMQIAIGEGRFRQDLFYRLSAVNIFVPPLRDRGRDIESLFRKFALEISERYQVPTIRLSPEAMSRLLQYPWPGNIRQLRNVVESLSVTIDTEEAQHLSADTLERYIPDGHRQSPLVPSSPTLLPSNEQQAFSEQQQIILQMMAALRHEMDILRQEVEKLKNKMLPSTETPPTLAISRNTSSQPALLPTAINPIARVAHAVQSSTETLDEVEEITETLPHESPKDLPTKEDMERELILRALKLAGGHRKSAADHIGISERTLYRKIKEYKLDL